MSTVDITFGESLIHFDGNEMVSQLEEGSDLSLDDEKQFDVCQPNFSFMSINTKEIDADISIETVLGYLEAEEGWASVLCASHNTANK